MKKEKQKKFNDIYVYMHIWIQRTININIILTDIEKRYKKIDMIFIHYKQNQNYKISYFYLRLLIFFIINHRDTIFQIIVPEEMN